MNSNEQEAFLKAYDELADAIYRHCFFRVYSKGRAEELMQETFMKVWNYILSGIKIDNLKAFLYRTANNLVIDESRKKKEESLEAHMEHSPTAEPARDSQADIERDMMLTDIRRAMLKLPPEAQELLTYRFIDDLDPKEIAHILNITPNNASVKITRALHLLKEQIPDHH